MMVTKTCELEKLRKVFLILDQHVRIRLWG